MKQDYYTISEAAEILGCSQNVISDLYMRRCIQGVQLADGLYVQKIHFDEYSKEIKRASRKISEMDVVLSAIDKECEEYKKHYRRIRNENWLLGRLHVNYISHILEDICKFIKVGTPLKPIEETIVLSVLNGHNLQSIAEENHKTKEGVRRAYMRGVTKIKTYLATFPAIIEANNRHKESIRELKNRVSELENENRILRLKLGIRGAKKNRIKDLHMRDIDVMINILNTKITDIDTFCLRTKHALMRADILTVADIVSRSHDQILGLRSIGIKCYTEIEEYLSRTGVKFKMNLSPYKQFLIHPTTIKK